MFAITEAILIALLPPSDDKIKRMMSSFYLKHQNSIKVGELL